MKVSVIIPVFNEENTLKEIYRRVKATSIPDEIILVDDGSTDNSPLIMRELCRDKIAKCVFKEGNSGKGAAVNAGLEKATGDVFIIGYEEPENGVHPVRLKRVADPFKNIQQQYLKQLIINTHSAVFPTYFEDRNLYV